MPEVIQLQVSGSELSLMLGYMDSLHVNLTLLLLCDGTWGDTMGFLKKGCQWEGHFCQMLVLLHLPKKLN